MNEHPIIFSGPMVKAIIEGRKTQTRRVCGEPKWIGGLKHGSLSIWPCPYGQPGDRLWVKESYLPGGNISYRADSPGDGTVKMSWKSGRFMPRWASRITLEITEVRVQRLQEITNRDAVAEGVEYDLSKPDGAPLSRFNKLWDSINGKKHPWKSNPWVWVISFFTKKS